jgi:hypothetical protein
MKYNMTVTISDPNTKEGMNSTLILKLEADYSYVPDTYGNGYYLRIRGKEGFECIYDLRYNMDFHKNDLEGFLKAWANSYWNGKDGAYKVDDLEITTDKKQALAQRLFDFIPHWDREYETVDEAAEDIKNNPETIIEYLLDLLEA